MIARPAPSMPLHFNSRHLNKTSGCSSHSSNNGDNNSGDSHSSKCPLGSHGNHHSNGVSRNNRRRLINHHRHCQSGQGCSHLRNSSGLPREGILITDGVDRGRDEVDGEGNMAGASPATTFLLISAKYTPLSKILADEQGIFLLHTGGNLAAVRENGCFKGAGTATGVSATICWNFPGDAT